jgi:hypothetical protein
LAAKNPYPQEFLGIERQKVRRDDSVERRRRYLTWWTSGKSERSRQWYKWKDLADHVAPGAWPVPHLGPQPPEGHVEDPEQHADAGDAVAGGRVPRRAHLTDPTVGQRHLPRPGPRRVGSGEGGALGVEPRIRLIFQFSNFYRTMAMHIYPGLATFGLGTCIARRTTARCIRFVPLAMGTYTLSGDGNGRSTPCSTRRRGRSRSWSISSAGTTSPTACGSPTTAAGTSSTWRSCAPSRRNSEFIPGTIGRHGKKWGSAWMEIGGLASAAGALSQPSSDPTIGFLRDSGYEEFPVLCARWHTTSRDIYPTGPGHDALPDIRQLMQLERRKLLAVSKGVNPAMLIPDALRLNRLSMLPGDAVYYPTGTQGVEIKAAHEVKPEWVREAREEARLRCSGSGRRSSPI